MLIRYLIIFLVFSYSVKSDQNDLRLNNLFKLLYETKNEILINKITSNIWEIWHETSDPLIEEDFFRGIESFNAGNLLIAVGFFTQVIEKNPNFAEAWNKRATVYYIMGDFNKSMNDIKVTLKLEPRHFGAMDGMGLIFINLQQYDKAIKIYDQMLKIFPNSQGTKEKKKLMKEYLLKSA